MPFLVGFFLHSKSISIIHGRYPISHTFLMLAYCMAFLAKVGRMKLAL